MQEYEDLDEIVARFVQPISALAKDIQTYKVFDILFFILFYRIF